MYKRLAFFAGLFFALALALVISARLLLDPRHYVREIQRQAAARLGVAVSVGGGAELTVFPSLGLVLEDVAIAAPEGFGSEPLIVAKEMELRVGLLPLLLRQQLTFDSITLNRPELRLQRLASGQTSWDKIVSRMQDSTTEANAEAWPVQLHGLEMTDGAIRWADDAVGEVLEFTEIDLSVGAGTLFDAALSGTIVDPRRKLHAHVSLKGNGRYLADPFDLVFQDAMFEIETAPDAQEGFPTDVRLAGRMDASLRGGEIVIKESELRIGQLRVVQLLLRGSRLFTPQVEVTGSLVLAGVDAGATTKSGDAKTLQALLATLQGKADLRVTGQEVRLEHIALAAANLDIEGQAVYAFEGRGAVDASFTLPRLNMEKLLSAETSAATALPDWLLQWPADWPEITLTLAIADLAGWSAKARSATLRFRTGSPALRTEFEASEFLGGSVAAGCGLRGKRLECTLASKRTQLDALAELIPDLASGSGTADINLEVAAPVDSLKDVPARLEASLTASLNQPGCTSAARPGTEPLTRTAKNKARPAPATARPGKSDAGTSIRAASGSVAMTLAPVSGSGGKSELLYETTGTLKLEKLTITSSSSSARTTDTADVTLALKGKTAFAADRPALRSLDAAQLQIGYQGTHLTSAPLSLQLRSAGVFDFERGSLRLANATLSGAGATLAGSLNVEGLSGAASPRFNASVKASTTSLRGTLSQLGLKPPVTRDATRLGACSANARLTLESGLLNCNDLNARLDDTSIRGSLTVQLPEKAGQQPGFHYTLTADGLDADSYRPPPESAPSKPEDWDTALLHGLRLEGTLSVARLTWLSLRLSAVRATLGARGGNIALTSITGEGYGGRLNGTLQLAVPQPQATPALSLSLAAEDVQLEPLLRDLGGGEDIGGRSQFSATLAGSGRNRQAMLRTLNGKAWLGAKDGFYVFSTTDTVGKPLLPGDMSSSLNSPPPQAGPQRTPYSEAKATLTVEKGVIRNDDFHVQGTLIQAKGSGYANLPQSSIDYTILVQLIGTPTLPFRIVGPLDSPDVTMRDVNLLTDTAGRLGGSVFDIVKGILTLPVKVIESLGQKGR